MSNLTKARLVEMLRNAAQIIEDQHVALSHLDEATGDGDHGVTIHRTMRAVTAALDESADAPLADLLKQIAMKVMMCDGGSTSPLLGSWFLGLAAAAADDELTPDQTAALFEAGLANFRKTSKASVGDKTMMDAFEPATQALVAELNASGDQAQAFQAAARKAAEGAELTKQYVARFGRARTMGERSLGHLDPGAKSISFIFEGFAQANA
ncbi:dihydroxyacetone kinase subunit DhaL [Aliiruegeria sabulilitoris]|uniref:dihydroxyacetone kinase subunit DhaL n=1 Tax=Aliiruegeria sabulilitoris TaxID=1510458 RepID=UPI000836A2C8|nr:dihydroxyacetone kinase subunit DhaL [Aliiruegeria sabulilitoris]